MKPNCLLLITLSITFFSCSSKHSAYSGEATGKISGNVYWKYNNVIGNKPDAGANVYLYTLDTTKQYQTTSCDVQGNFSFTGLQDGPYLVVVRSENTTSRPRDFFMNASDSATLKYVGFYLRDLNKSISDSMSHTFQKYADALGASVHAEYGTSEADRLQKEAGKLDDLTDRYADSVTSMIPNTPKFKPFEKIGTYPKKIRLEEVSVKNGQASAVNVDFGTTYL